MIENQDDPLASVTAYAHTKEGFPPQEWHRLEQHLCATAALAGTFAERFGSEMWGRLAGRWHDLGKYSGDFQAYLRASCGIEGTSPGQRTDHKSAGAQHAVGALPVLGHLLGYVIGGHHGGLPDGIADGPCLESLLKSEVPHWKYGLQRLPSKPESAPSLPSHVCSALNRRNPFAIAFFTRMLFSCLVDADFLDTERFMAPERAASRYKWPSDVIGRMDSALTAFVKRIPYQETTVDDHRRHVREACLAAAHETSGLFSLTVPTGGGKTLSSLAFALRHAVRHGLDRVIYVAPFTSIIEQNAEVFRKAMDEVNASLEQDVILEHHSNIAVVERESLPSRLATENWDAPLIVTTSVQFYESLFHNKSSRCRKIHRIARSVVILDEVQALPVHLLQPCLLALRELVEGYGTTVVLCTATQPALHRREGFNIGLEGVREIVPDPTALSADLKRVTVEDLGERGDDDLASDLLREDQVLCIVNTRAHARELYTRIGKKEGHIHLSALMIPAHRSRVINDVRERLERGETCRLVATQLIEAGVDIDFPVVYRSLAGLDSIAQAAGRCNRNGRIPEGGRTYIFRSTKPRSERFLKETQAATRQALYLYEDPLSLEAIERYFKLYYWDQSDRWDEKGITGRFQLDKGNRDFPFLFDFKTCARDFRLIEESGRPVIVPWEAEGHQLCERLRNTGPLPPRDILRRLQRYTIQIPERVWLQHLDRGIEMVHDRYALLTSPDVHYTCATGLNLDNASHGTLII